MKQCFLRNFLGKCVSAAASAVVVWSLASMPSSGQTKDTQKYAPPALPSGPLPLAGAAALSGWLVLRSRRRRR